MNGKTTKPLTDRSMTVELVDELKYAFRSKWPPRRPRRYSNDWGYGMTQDEFDPDIGDR